MFSLSLPSGLPFAGTGGFHEQCSSSAANNAVCPVIGFDHRRTATLAHHLGGAPGGAAASVDCMRHASELGPVVEDRMHEFGLLSMDMEPQFDDAPLRFSAVVG